MRRIMYLSRASSTMTAEKAAAIAEKSRRKNESLGITGVLALEDGVFLQILEGPDMAVAQRFDAIRGDFRHQAFITLSDGPVQSRCYPGQPMQIVAPEELPQDAREALLSLYDLAPKAPPKTLRQLLPSFTQ